MPENFSLADIADRSALQKAIDQNECPALYRLVIDVATASPHREFAEALCIELASHDDELVRGALKARLTVLGIRHDFAASRCELESLVTTQGWPDHAILDDMLGGSETGLEIADWLADHLGTSHILMVTGNSEPERLKELDASPYILMRKPVTSEQLIGWLRDVKVG